VSDAYTWYREERERAEGLWQKLNRVAFLIGYYGERAKGTGNSDLAELVDELKRLVHGPVPEDTTAPPASARVETAGQP